MSGPILPFESTARGLFRREQASLRDAYSEATIQSFVEKLRQLAVVSPGSCGALFDTLDRILAGMVEEATTNPTPVGALQANLSRLRATLDTFMPKGGA